MKAEASLRTAGAEGQRGRLLGGRPGVRWAGLRSVVTQTCSLGSQSVRGEQSQLLRGVGSFVTALRPKPSDRQAHLEVVNSREQAAAVILSPNPASFCCSPHRGMALQLLSASMCPSASGFSDFMVLCLW